MDHTYWYRQGNTPLFPDIVWSRPESKHGAGKLAIIGGNSHGFSAVGAAFNAASEAGVGVCRVLLPDAVRKTVAKLLPDADYAPTTPSGSFSIKALDELLSISTWSDAVLLAGDVGRNSETAMLLERYVSAYSGLLTVTQDAADYFRETPLLLMDRPNTLCAVNLSQLQKMFIATPTITPITYSMSTQQLAEALHDYTESHPAIIVTAHNGSIFVAEAGKVSTTKYHETVWRVDSSAKATVFWLQNPTKAFEAITTSLTD